MREHPIIFSGKMVRAILEGRKTQTRRVVSLNNGFWGCTSPGVHDHDWSRAWADPGLGSGGYWHVPFKLRSEEWADDPQLDTSDRFRCRWEVGDRPWVKETWAPQYVNYGHPCDFKADFPPDDPYFKAGSWKSPIFLPRRYSRLVLSITEVRAQRLHDISEEDALAEGVTWTPGPFSGPARPEFAHLWGTLYGDDPVKGWLANPPVWAVTFQVEAGR